MYTKYAEKYFYFWMHDSFNRYGVHWDSCTYANDLGYIKFCIYKSIAYELWVQHEVYQNQHFIFFLYCTQEVHRKI